MNIIVDFFTTVGVLAVCLVILAGLVSWWENREIDRQFAAADDQDPARSSATPLVPPQWRPSEDQLRDPFARDTTPLTDPAS